MVPVGVRHAGRKGWQVVHRCEVCGEVSTNRIAGGSRQPDNLEALLCLIRRQPLG